MGFADWVRDLLSGGSGKHQKSAHGGRGGHAHGAGSGTETRADQAAWRSAEAPAAGGVGQAANGADHAADVTDPVSGTGGKDQATPGTGSQN